MSLLDQMPHRVTHTRPGYQRDELIGDTDENPTTVATLVKCWVQNASMREINEYQRRNENVTHKVYFPTDPGLLVGDYLTVTSGPSFVGTVLKFQADSDRSAGLGVLYGAMCEEER